MGTGARTVLLAIAAVACTARAFAQPAIVAVPTPAANRHGWTNSAAEIEFACGRAVSCPKPVVAETEGAGQVFEATAHAGDGTAATTHVTLNLDWTAPVVTIESPTGVSQTKASTIEVAASASDELSGLRTATCNGHAAAIAPDGSIRCVVTLEVGANDVVVEASDRADNSGSAGFRVVRLAATAGLSIVPELLGMIVGQVTTVQVRDGSGFHARDVSWHIDNPTAGVMSSDGRHVFTAKAPGAVTVTATAGAVSAQAMIVVYAGDRLPSQSTRWKIGTSRVMQTPDTEPLKPTTKNVVTTLQKPGGLTTVESINQSSGWLNWRERPASTRDETAAAVRELPLGGAAVVFDSAATGQSAIARSGEPPWRYQSAGRIRREMLVSADGGLLAMETTPAGYTRLVAFDSRTGRVASRQLIPSGVHVMLNVSCIPGANGGRMIPGQVGPLNQHGQQGVLFGLVLSDDREDFGTCGKVEGSFKRLVKIVTIGYDGPLVDTAAVVEVAATSGAPVIELFEVAIDRHGAKLLPWAVRSLGTGPNESHLTRITNDGRHDFVVPAAGKVWLSGLDDDVAVMTDGFKLVNINVVTGVVRFMESYEQGVRIVDVSKGRVLYHTGGRNREVTLGTKPVPQR